MNTLGNKLKVTIFGQSHAPAIGCVIDGLPAGFAPDMERVAAFNYHAIRCGADVRAHSRKIFNHNVDAVGFFYFQFLRVFDDSGAFCKTCQDSEDWDFVN